MSNDNSGFEKNLGHFFKFQEFGTTLHTEIIAGTSTYLALVPSFILIPAVLSKSGIDPSAVLFATVVAASFATLLMGLLANLPFAVSAGIEIAGLFAFVVCGTLHMSWQEGLGIVFISGLLCLIFTALSIRKNIIDSIPPGLKKAIGTSVGVFVATIGLLLAHIIVFNGSRIDFGALSASSLFTNSAFVLYSGLFLSVVFSITSFRFPGGMLVAILIGALLCSFFGIKADTPPQFSSKMLDALGRLRLEIVFNPVSWSPIIVFFIIDFLGGIGKFIGLTANTNIQDDKGNVPNLTRALYVDGAGTVIASFLGTSSLIAYVESAVGIEAGGRTGCTSVVCGLLILASLVLTPVMRWIPAEAVAGVLLFVGYLLLPWVGGNGIDQNTRRFDIYIAVVMGIISFITFSLDKALAFGFWAYFIQSFTHTEVTPTGRVWLGGIAAILTGTIVWQLIKT